MLTVRDNRSSLQSWPCRFVRPWFMRVLLAAVYSEHFPLHKVQGVHSPRPEQNTTGFDGFTAVRWCQAWSLKCCNVVM